MIPIKIECKVFSIRVGIRIPDVSRIQIVESHLVVEFFENRNPKCQYLNVSDIRMFGMQIVITVNVFEKNHLLIIFKITKELPANFQNNKITIENI